MKKSIKKGFGFGITSGIITTLGLIVGLYSGTNSKMIVLGGILMIAIADAMSDSLGIHIAEEFSLHKTREVWESTLSTFFTKLIFASIFILPFLFFNLQKAIIFCIVAGLIMLGAFSYYIAKKQKANTLYVIMEHLVITILVIVSTYYVGIFVKGLS